MPRILVVCTGNICRSPTGQILLQHQLTQAGLDDWIVESAGTWALDGHPATQFMVDLMAQRGLDLTAHRAQTVNRQLLDQADLVLVMTHNHAEALGQEFPDQSGKIHLLSEMKDRRRYDIKDPYGGTLAEYRACVTQLVDLIENGLDRIIDLTRKNVAKRKWGA